MNVLGVYQIADICRTVALVMGGMAGGLAVSEALLYYRRKRSPGDPWEGHKRLDYMVGVRVAILLMTMFIVGVLIDRLGEADITWRAPCAVATFAVAIWGMLGILKDDETIQDDPSLDYRGPYRRATDKESSER